MQDKAPKTRELSVTIGAANRSEESIGNCFKPEHRPLVVRMQLIGSGKVLERVVDPSVAEGQGRLPFAHRALELCLHFRGEILERNVGRRLAVLHRQHDSYARKHQRAADGGAHEHSRVARSFELFEELGGISLARRLIGGKRAK